MEKDRYKEKDKHIAHNKAARAWTGTRKRGRTRGKGVGHGA